MLAYLCVCVYTCVSMNVFADVRKLRVFIKSSRTLSEEVPTTAEALAANPPFNKALALYRRGEDSGKIEWAGGGSGLQTSATGKREKKEREEEEETRREKRE